LWGIGGCKNGRYFRFDSGWAGFGSSGKGDSRCHHSKPAGGCFDSKAKGLFENTITKLVKDEITSTEYLPHEDGWDFITIPLKGGKYCFDLNYDWKSVQIGFPDNNAERNPQVEKYLAQQMTEWTHHSNEGAPVFALYGTNLYPGLESVDEGLYFYRLYKEYAERPQEVAAKITAIAKALETDF
jgi:hypothetical protein